MIVCRICLKEPVYLQMLTGRAEKCLHLLPARRKHYELPDMYT